MDLLRKYMWIWVVVGAIFASVVICIIFLLINKCITRAGKHRIAYLQRRSEFSINSNKYQEGNFKADIPPLPPRTQFLTAEAQSYENLAEAPECEHSTGDYEEASPDYVQDTADYVESLPEYVKVEDEKILPPPPPYTDPDPAADDPSTEDYDDIGDENEVEGEEDYDDVA